MMSSYAGPFGEAWIAAYFAEVDRMSPDGLVAWYTDDGRFRFGNNPAVQGKAAVADVLRGFYGSITSMSHARTGCWVDGESGVREAEVTFGLPDGRTITIPAVSVLRTRDGKVDDFRMVMDAAPLFAG
jgi:ketosteroid isomerase-like protein